MFFDAEDSDQARRGSIVTLDHEMRIVGFQEKPLHPTGQVIGACIYILPFPTLQRTDEFCVKEGEVMNRAISLSGSARKKWYTDLGCSMFGI